MFVLRMCVAGWEDENAREKKEEDTPSCRDRDKKPSDGNKRTKRILGLSDSSPEKVKETEPLLTSSTRNVKEMMFYLLQYKKKVLNDFLV
jgi:hypothetical protein